MIDTHAHLYAEEFDHDREAVVERAQSAGVTSIILPNIDSTTLNGMLHLENAYPNYCYPAIGLHPTSVNADWKQELEQVKKELERRRYIAVGEIGIDLYWDKSFYREQVAVFQQQVEWALSYSLPIIIHVRNAFKETIKALAPFRGKGLRGVFHSFTGTREEAQEILDFWGFKIGVNGIVTFKNSNLSSTLSTIPVENLLLETDAPYLTPTPYRGKRNESAYVQFVAEKLATIYRLSPQEIGKITTQSANELFGLTDY